MRSVSLFHPHLNTCFFARACKIVNFEFPSIDYILPPWAEHNACMSLDSGSPNHDRLCRNYKEGVKGHMNIEAFCTPSKKETMS